MTLRTSLPDMCLLQRNTTGNLSCNSSEPDALLLKCKQLYERYLFHVNANLSKGVYSGSKVYLSSVNDLTLNEFVVVRKLYCKLHHRDTTPEECSRCHPLICLSERICSEGICELSSLYREVFPTLQYQSDKAVRKLMQLPVAIFKLEFSGPGSQRLYVSEIRAMVDYDAFCQVCQMVFSSETMNRKEKGLTKEALDLSCQLATSESDRCLIKYSVCKSQGLSAKKAKTEYGFNDLHSKGDMIMKAVEQAQAIRDAVMQLASVNNKATLKSLGYELPDDSENSSSDSEGSDFDQLVSESDVSADERLEEGVSDSDVCDTETEVHDPNVNFERNKNSGQERSDSDACTSDSSIAISSRIDSGCVLGNRNQLTKGTECSTQRDLNGTIDPDAISKQKEDGMIVIPTPSMEHMLLMLRSNELNWFSFVEELRMLLREFTPEALNDVLLDFANYLASSDLDRNEERLIEQSRQAYLERERRRVMIMEENSNIASDSESDNPDDWVGVEDSKQAGKRNGGKAVEDS